MATIVYLDVEDEITSAATRIRTASESRVALVLPFGSRLSTSRINFRLLAREAMVYGRRLDVIAPDASARALAASAGLPVFGSVGEYEAALEAPVEPAAAEPGDAPGTDGGAATESAGAAAAGGAAAGAAAAGAAAATPGPPVTTSSRAAAGPRDRGRGRAAAGPAEADGPTTGAASAAGAGPPDDMRREPRVVHGPGRWRPGTSVLVGFGILVVALLAAGVAAFVFLPAAEITVTPRIETIGPVSLTVRADPTATSVDAAAGVIPAQTLDVPVQSSGEFPATGKRIDEAKATGGVRWTNCDPTAAYTIAKGSTVKTSNGVAFTTDEAVFLPVAIITSSLQLQCQTSEVSVTAVTAGTAGNVAVGAIKVVPPRYNANVIRVTNLAATSGGKHDEFPRIVQQDVDAAVQQLRKDLMTQFATAVTDGANAPAGVTVFPGTESLGDPQPSVDPASLVGQEVASFTLSMSATGQVLAVDSSPVKSIAEARLQGSTSAGYELVAGSIDVTVGEGTVNGGTITFPVEGTAKQVRTIDAAALKSQVLGLGEQAAKDLLAPDGTVEIRLWPDWVSSVPSLDQRVTLTVAPPVDATPSPSPSVAPSTQASSAPSAAPSTEASPGGSGDAPASQPVPSG